MKFYTLVQFSLKFLKIASFFAEINIEKIIKLFKLFPLQYLRNSTFNFLYLLPTFFIGVNNSFFENSSVYLRQDDFKKCGNSFGETRSP